MRKRQASVQMMFIAVVVRVRGFDLAIMPHHGKPRIKWWRVAGSNHWRSDLEILPISSKTKGDVLRRAYVALFKLNVPQAP